jgi:hypothetical protein
MTRLTANLKSSTASRRKLDRHLSTMKNRTASKTMGFNATKVAPCLRLIPVRAKLLSKSEVPAFIPRDDLMEQLYRWAELEAQHDGVTNFGIACKLDKHEREDALWGFTVHMERVRAAALPEGDTGVVSMLSTDLSPDK